MRGEYLFDGCLILPPEADLSTGTKEVPGTAGVCLLTNDQLQPILLLYGANLRHLVRRRLTVETEGDQNESQTVSRRTRLRPIVTRIWFRRTYSPFETQLAYFRIAREVYPETYQEWFGRLETWFVYLNSAGEYPFWEITSQLRAETVSYWGPFATKKAAASYLEILQSLFDLCRCPVRISQGNCSESCAYAQMNRCAALEQGKFSPEKYQALIREAAQFLHDIPPQIQIWREQMKQRSADQQFEKAQRLKERIAQGQKLLGQNYRWAMPLEQFYVLSFQHGPKMKSTGRKKELAISGFLLSLWGIDQIEPIPLSQAVKAAQGLLDHLHFKQLQSETSASLMPSELFAWATQILYKKNQDKNLFLRAQNDLTAEQITQHIRRHFSRPAKTDLKLKLDNLSLTEHKEGYLSENELDNKR
jgi:hypothetical protein